MRFLKLLFFALTTSLLFAFALDLTFAQSTDEQLKQKENEIRELENKVSQLQNQEKTLSLQISVMNNQIKLTELRIETTKQLITKLTGDINLLSGKIETLEGKLKDVSEILLNRISVSYKVGTVDPIQAIFASKGFSDFISRAKYIRVAQEHDRRLLFELEQTKINYNNQKNLLHGKQEEQKKLQAKLEILGKDLAQQKKDKEALLVLTRNDEKRYQEILAKARAEEAAILKILAGGGNVAQVGPVKAGDTVGSTIVGASACSSGSHLHFEAVKDGGHQNPAAYLRNISLTFESQVQSFTPSGSWDWPMAEPIRINQEYGMTYWARLGWYGGGPHTGIDMFQKDLPTSIAAPVKAVKDGTLFKGSIACGGGTLKFSRVDQTDGIQTYYYHIN